MSLTDVYARKLGEYQDHVLIPHSAAGLVSKRFEFYGVFVACSDISIYADADGATQLILNTDYSLTEKDTTVTGEEIVDAWKTYTVDNAAYQGVPLYISMRIWGGYTQYKTPTTFEWPNYGEVLPAASELFLDGTDSLISSDGREPVVDVVDYEPAKINVDGSEVDNPVVKWPGYRGSNGFFGEYENNGNEDSLASTAASTKSLEGDWTKVQCTSAGASAFLNKTGVSHTTNGFGSGYIRKGNTNFSRILVTSGSWDVQITWSTQSIAFGSGTDAGSFFIDSNTVYFSVLGAAVGGGEIRAYASTSSASVDDYSYYKDILWVDLPYPVPYTKGVHPASKLQYDFDWATSDEWTIEFKTDAAVDPEGVNRGILLTTGLASTVSNALTIYITEAGQYTARLNGPGGTYTMNGGSAVGIWVDIKAIISTTLIALYVDGSLIESQSISESDLSFIPKLLWIGMEGGISGIEDIPNCYIQDLRITPTIDTSTTHYTSGLPYYNPEKTYGQDASWSIDKRGNVSGLFQQAGVIVDDYELDGQRVTKWDTGLITVTGLTATFAASPTSVLFVHEVLSIDGLFAVPFTSGTRYVTTGGASSSGFSIYMWNGGSVATGAQVYWSVIGRYK